MAKKKKNVSKQVSVKKTISKSYLDKAVAVSRKVLQMLELDPDLINHFSKKQRQNMFLLRFCPPRVCSEKGYRVPRKHIEYLRNEVFFLLNEKQIEQSGISVSLMDMCIYGCSFVLNIQNIKAEEVSEELWQTVTIIKQAIEGNNFFNRKIHGPLIDIISFLMLLLSKLSFRIYECRLSLSSLSSNRFLFGYSIYISSFENEIIYFNHNEKNRIAYRVGRGAIDVIPRLWVTIPAKLFRPGSTSEKEFDLYIQSHSFHRLRERLDLIDATLRNTITTCALLEKKTVVRAPDGRPLLACLCVNKLIGYFVLKLQDNRAFILTFLPLVSDKTPEGKKFCDRMQLSREDVIYLGMDKLSFYYDVDFEQIPLLKTTMQECNLWDISRIFKDDLLTLADHSIDERKTQFVKKFFEQRTETETNKAEVLNEVAEKYN